MTEPSTLLIRLHGEDIGFLRKGTRTSFAFSRAYLDLPRRPVLGQAFEDDLRRRYLGGGGLLPAFFSNLLPEGVLRRGLANELRIGIDDEFALLAALGEDLPGAVTATPFDEASAGQEAEEEVSESPPSSPRQEGVIRFSLAGVQFKLSMLRDGERLTLPASGRGGKWIVKLPSPSYLALPENEYATMAWARRSGLGVAEHELVSLDRLDGVPQHLLEGLQGQAFVTRRYDREPSGRRIHQEDFAQVLEVFPVNDRIYRATNYETLAMNILLIAGREGLNEFLRRLVFVVLSGNGDAHMKNWSLYYPDAIRAELSPAYDLVATIQYMPKDEMALNLSNTRSFEEISLASFQRLARKIEVSEADIAELVRASVEATFVAWHALKDELPVPKAYKVRVEEHLRKVPLGRVR